MSVIARGTTKSVKIIYPSGCKEVTEELGKDELVRRLKLIARAFQDMGQDDNDQYTGLALHLATDFFLEHHNKDVRLLVACCIADVFRIFAPEAPFRDAAHLKDIFMFLIKQLRGLEDPNSPTFKRYFYLLENLAWVKSFNICIELDDNQEIFCSLFKLMFSVINEKHTTKVKNFMLDMMSPLLTEADVVSQELLDILLINVVEPQKSQNKQTYGLAKDLLIKTSNAIEPYVQNFFNNALMLGKTSESELSEHLYDLIYELNAICPSVLLAVLPQLEFKLKSNEETERKQVTKILSKMFSDPESNLADQNKALWICFLGRFNDISITVRTICVQSAVSFVLHHPELTKDVIEQVKIRQHDAEETVRQEVVNTLLNIAKKNFATTTPEMLEVIKERTRDKKFKIRRDALNGLGQLYKVVTMAESVSQEHLDKIVWVKNKIFHAYYQQNPEDRLLVERLFNICLVPYQLPVTERMKRLFQLYATLDEPATKAFHEMMKHRHMVRTCVKFLLDGLDKMTANPREHVVFLPKLQQIARTLPDTQKSLEQVKLFNEMMRDDRRLRSLMRYLVSADCNCRKANENVKDVLNKKLGGGNVGSSQSAVMLYNTIKSLLERVAPVMVDSSAITVLVKHVDDAVTGQGTIADHMSKAGEKGAQLLLCLAGVFPQYFQGEETFDTLISFLKDEDEVVADVTLQVFASCGLSLEAEYPEIFAKLLPILQHTAKIGNPKQAKHALRCINSIAKTNRVSALSQVFEYVKNNLKPESANYITSIVALGHISSMCPEDFSQSMKTIVSKDIVKDLLMQDRTHGRPVMDSWYGDHLVTEETNAKIQAMKLLVRWLIGLKSNVNNSCTSTLRLLYTVIVHEGDLMEKGLINKPELARLRLQAGCAILKLAEEPVFADLLQREQFQALALLINDSCYHVRVKFADKLHKGLYSLKLPLEFMSIFSLAANDPVRERRTSIKRYIQLNIQRRRDFLKQNPALGGKMFLYLPDYVMPYTVHLLAHDPDLKSYEDVQALKNIKECLWFIMEPLVARSEDYNYHFFRRLIENIKQAKDAQEPEDEETNNKLYAVCDLALGLLQKNLTNIVLKDENVDPVLPCKLFTKPEKGALNSVVYLPKDFNFEKKKGLTDTTHVAPQSMNYRKRQENTTVETIIVKSPGPVVNPYPTCPKEPKAKKKKEESSQDTESVESEPTSKKPAKSRSRSATTDDKDEASESADMDTASSVGSESGAESKQSASTKTKPVRGRGKKTAGNNKRAAAKSSQDTSEVNSEDSQEDMDTSQEAKDSSSQDSENTTPPPPKKRILKRTVAEAEKLKAQQSNKKTTDKSSASDSKDKSKGQTEKKGVQKKGKGVVNGANKGGKGAKRTATPDSDSDESEESVSPKKRKFNLEKDAVPAPKLGKKVAASKKKKVEEEEEEVEEMEEEEEESEESNPSTPSETSQDSFKAPNSPAPKATPKRGAAAAKAKAGAKGKVKSPSTSPASSPRSSVSSKTSSQSPKSAAEKKQTGKSPKPTAKATVTVNKNVRRAKPLANGTTGSDTDTKKASALARIIKKGTLGKETKKAAVAKGKKK